MHRRIGIERTVLMVKNKTHGGAGYIKIFTLVYGTAPALSTVHLLLSLLRGLLVAVQVALLGSLTDRLMEKADISGVILMLVLYIAFVMVVPRFLGICDSLIVDRIRKRVDVKFTEMTMRKAMSVPIPTLENAKTYSKLQKIRSYNSTGMMNIMNGFISILSCAVSVISLMFTIGYISLLLIAVMGIISLLQSAVNRKLDFDKIQYDRRTEEKRRWNSHLYGMMMARQNAAEFWSYDIRRPLFAIWYDANKMVYKEDQAFQAKQSAIRMFNIMLQYAGFFVSYMLLLVFGGRGILSVSVIVSCIYAMSSFYGITGQLTALYDSIKRDRTLYEDFRFVMELSEENTAALPDVKLPFAIDIENVSYQYPAGRSMVLHHLDLHIKDGERIVLVGKNGSGKSTLIRLLLGYDFPTEGRIAVGGMPIAECLGSVRDNGSVMFQDYARYNMTLRDNIIISDECEEHNDMLLQEAVDWSDVEKLISSTKEGYNTLIFEERGFSGGQWQRIALTRAKFRKRSFVVLDEPNAAVDAFYEERLYRRFFDMTVGCTTVIVSHRLPICKLADRIVVMDDGKICEIGSHDELMKIDGGVYKMMFEKQAELYAD